MQRKGRGRRLREEGRTNLYLLGQQSHSNLLFKSSTRCFFMLTAFHPSQQLPVVRHGPSLPSPTSHIKRSRILSCNTFLFSTEASVCRDFTCRHARGPLLHASSELASCPLTRIKSVLYKPVQTKTINFRHRRSQPERRWQNDPITHN